MSQIPFIPENAPFSPEQRLWLNGYLAGLFSDASNGARALAGLSAAPAVPTRPLAVLYGSQTGTAEGLAKKLSKQAEKRGFAPRLVDMAKYETVDLTKEQNVLVITSTYGDGDPPDNAQSFWNFLKSDTVPPLPHLHYSVLALGDTNYSAFCQFGKNCDERLATLGAKCVHPRTDCDIEYEAPAQAWMEGVFAALASSPQSAASIIDAEPVEETAQGWSRKNPFPARLLVNRKLNGEGSGKEVRHYEISLADSGLSYEVGDALGVLPANCGELVGEVLAALGCDGEEAVKAPDGCETSLRLALAQHYDITRPSLELLKAVAERGTSGELAALLDPARKDDLKTWLWGREVIDLISSLASPFSAAEFMALLKKLPPRLYSISSSLKAHPDEVHLTIAAVRYHTHGRARKGVCSTFLADRCAEGGPVPVFVQVSHGFRVPAQDDVPIIMCGPGTGIAPFRAFLEERRATGANGRNWLLFGDQKRATDFLYQEQLENWVADGHLARLDLAFSRDQAEKIYVQDRMLENAAELWAWLESGAHFYVCGDANRMAKDVDAALHTICETAGGLSKDSAAEYVGQMKSAKRYQRDVYESMSTAILPVNAIDGQSLSPEQTTYLTGFFAGVTARGQRFSDVEAAPAVAKTVSHEDLIFEERVKKELHPLDAYSLLLDHAAANKAPDKEEVFRFKWNGLFYLTPNKEAFMARLRIPGGQLRSFQLRELAHVAKELTTGYVQITTRANLQMRLIQPKDTPELLRRIQSVGLHTRGAGADNIRNLTANPTAGIDPHELIDVSPLCHEMAQIIINDRSFYDLPRKFNIAYDGGGLIGTVEDTNDIGCKAVKAGDEVLFRIALGGATGHKAFARDLGVLVRAAELNKVVAAVIRVYIAHGNRGDRKKARLKHLLEHWTLEQYLEETEKVLGYKLQRAPLDPAAIQYPGQKLPHSHAGVFPQKQNGLNYIGATIPVGHLTPRQMLRVAEIADLYGSGEIRLTVWQNFILPNVPDHFVATVQKALRKIGFDTQQSHLRSGLIACTGNSYCKFAQADTKGHALKLADYLDKRVELDQPVNIHFTGCPNSCAQHYMGDIGLLGTKAKVAGESQDGYHVFVGGGFGAQQAVGRQVFNAIAFDSLPPLIENILKGYLRHRHEGENFQSFTARHDLNTLQAIFSNDE